MKKKILLSVVSLALIMSACKLDSSVYYDDVYTTSSDKQYEAVSVNKAAETYDNTSSDNDYVYEENFTEAAAAPTYSSSETYTDGGGTTYVTNNYYYDSDDYYDYAYTARIRRFHSPVCYSWGYYDPYYTNLYWYDCYPGNWGVSIYLGYDWYWPRYYRPIYTYGYCSYGFSYSWGWGSIYCGSRWHHGYPGYYAYGYGGYRHGYHDGYRHGYYDGIHAGYYHNNYDRNRSFTYGHFNRGGANNGKANDRDYDRGDRPDMAGNNSGMGGGN